MDNRFIERLWRSLKYEDIYLQDYVDGLGSTTSNDRTKLCITGRPGNGIATQPLTETSRIPRSGVVTA